MDSNYRPASPDLSATTTTNPYCAPASPELSGTSYRPASPDLTGARHPFAYSNNDSNAFYTQQYQPQPQYQQAHYQAEPIGGGGVFGGRHSSYGGYAPPTSIPPQQHTQSYPYQQGLASNMTAPYGSIKNEDGDEYMPDAPAAKRPRKGQTSKNGRGGMQDQKPLEDATLGVDLKTSFPVARIKRIMQADEDIGKVAQVTPHVVSRALELFMIKLISAAADQARGSAGTSGESGGGGSGGGKSAGTAKKVAPQHLKQAIMKEQTFDFLQAIMEKVPDAPTKAKKECKESDSDEAEKKPKKKGKKKKDSDGT